MKRLESSFHAFRLTLGRFIHSYDRVIAEFHKGHVYISKKHISKIFELLESDDQEAIERLLDEEKAERLDGEGFLARVHSAILEADSKNSQADCSVWEENQPRPQVGVLP